MPLDPSRIEGFGSKDDEKKDSFWGSAFSSWQDVSDMANDFKSFVANGFSHGGDEEEEEEDADQAQASKSGPMSPRQRQEALMLVAQFCENYPAARVSPKPNELEALWANLSQLHPRAVSGAIYEQISFASGETDWRPRLRALYMLEYIHATGEAGQDITLAVWQQASGLLEHLSKEVLQCREKATEVTLLLSGKAMPAPIATSGDGREASTATSSAGIAAAPGGAVGSTASTAPPAKAAAPPIDLLDLSDPVTTPVAPSSSSSASPAPAVVPPPPPADLLDVGVAPAAVPAPAPIAVAQDFDLLFEPTRMPGNVPANAGVVPAAAATPTAAAPDDLPFDPNKPTGNLGGANVGFSNAGLSNGNGFATGLSVGGLAAPGGSSVGVAVWSAAEAPTPAASGYSTQAMSAVGSGVSASPSPLTASSGVAMGSSAVPNPRVAAAGHTPAVGHYLPAAEWQSAMSAMSPSKNRDADPFFFLIDHTGIAPSK